jgi:hypothetical protein
MTPLFPVIGFNQLVFRFMDPQTRLLLTTGSSMAVFTAMTLVPNAFYYAPVLLPFAIGNGITAMGLYAILEKGAGGPERLAALNFSLFSTLYMPVAGPALGVGTALITPFTYPIMWALVYPELGVSSVETALDFESYSAIWNLMFGEFLMFGEKFQFGYV